MDSQKTYLALATMGAFLLGGVITVVAILQSQQATWPTTPNALHEDSVDAIFIEQMIPHHQGAIDMAEVALENAEHDELMQLAEAIINAQQTEIDDMRTWYKEWYGTDVPTLTGSHHGHMETMSGDLEKLESASNFDVEFIDQMIPHHEAAIMMAEMMQGTATHQEIKTLAENIITSQAAEIEQMKTWREEWE